jgi:hypothetical protein
MMPDMSSARRRAVVTVAWQLAALSGRTKVAIK